ncbi:alpha/beta hydrolase [Streptomyces sp. TG1A-60]|uniref:alpha/beta hydrolase n=1 Tax=Streptomyces sp. TG1A-60 TaxID=3129111 RepID=UPI0030D5B9ED
MPTGTTDQPAAHRSAVPTHRPILLAASASAPVTPIAEARRLSRLLPGSRLVALDNDYSRGVFASRGNACTGDTAAAYPINGRWAAGVPVQGPGLPGKP